MSASDTECTVKITAQGETSGWWARATGRSTPSTRRSATPCAPAYPVVEGFELTDYRVRILEQGHGTDAAVRVLIQTSDGRRLWTTVGVGQNMIEASWEALSDAYLYGLMHAGPWRSPTRHLAVRGVGHGLRRRPYVRTSEGPDPHLCGRNAWRCRVHRHMRRTPVLS